MALLMDMQLHTQSAASVCLHVSLGETREALVDCDSPPQGPGAVLFRLTAEEREL